MRRELRSGDTLAELDLIRLIRDQADQLGRACARVSIGDDAAVLRPPAAGFELLATTDQLVEGTHFIPDVHPPHALGRKTLARGLSDIAAMGGEPLWFLLSLVIPRRTDASGRCGDAWIKQYLSGLFSSTKAFGLSDFPLVGGDVASGGEFHAHVTVVGEAPAGKALLRSGARPGDRLYVSGSLGGSALGLERLVSGAHGADDPSILRHLEPTPRLALGRFLREAGVSSAIDISDGLSTDLAHLAEASGVAAHVDPSAVPRFPDSSLDQALHGGEEYELLFTAPPDATLPAAHEGVPLRRIGSIEAGEGLFLRENGRTRPLAAGGYEHRW